MRRAIACCAVLVACGGSTIGAQDSGTQPAPDAGMQPMDMADASDTDTMTPEAPYPAPHPAGPRVLNSNGPVLNNFLIVPVFWSNDPLQMQVEQFIFQLEPSTYWTATTTEYGAGPFKIAPSVVITDPPPTTIDDGAIGNWLAAHADGSNKAWPKADGNTLYALFYPSGTTITLQNSQSCQSFGAYHSNTNLMNGTDVPYAVMPRCGGGIDTLTVSTSHEFVEAATDPLPMSNPAYSQIDIDHVIWELRGGGETGDMCETYSTSIQRLVGNFAVQRTWSNKAMADGHDPCVPAGTDVYFNASPDLHESVTMSFGGQGIKTKGVKVPLMQSKTISVYLYSDAPKAAWTVSAADRGSQFGGMPYLDFKWDRTTGKNGDVLQLTITSLRTNYQGAVSFTISSTDSKNVRHSWYGVVGFN